MHTAAHHLTPADVITAVAFLTVFAAGLANIPRLFRRRSRGQ